MSNPAINDPVLEVKAQYAKILTAEDSDWFKKVAEYYLKTAANLKNEDIKPYNGIRSLLFRNAQKRLYLGIGCELLLKAYYLKEGYCINEIRDTFGNGYRLPTNKLADVADIHRNPNNTFQINTLITQLHSVGVTVEPHIRRGFQIAMTFRNKEGHITSKKHEFADENYRDVEKAFIDFYRQAFNQKLSFRIFMKAKDKAVFRISNLPE